LSCQEPAETRGVTSPLICLISATAFVERHFSGYLRLWLERGPFSPRIASALALGLLPPLGYCPLHWGGHQGGPHTCATGPAGISLTTPPSWIPVTACQLAAQCICTLLMLIFSSLLTAQCFLLTANARLLKAFACLFVKNNCCCTTSRSCCRMHILTSFCKKSLKYSPDILHNLRWLLFHPHAVTPLGSSRGHVSPRLCTSRALTYAYVLKVIKSITHTKRVASQLPVTCFERPIR
jgi:hypothetical protein